MLRFVPLTLSALLLSTIFFACASPEQSDTSSSSSLAVSASSSSLASAPETPASLLDRYTYFLPSDPPYDFAEGVTLELPDRIELDEGGTYQIEPVCTGVENPEYSYRCTGGDYAVLSVTEDGFVTGEHIGFDYVWVTVYDPDIDHVAAYGAVWFTVGDIIVGSK